MNATGPVFYKASEHTLEAFALADIGGLAVTLVILIFLTAFVAWGFAR